MNIKIDTGRHKINKISSTIMKRILGLFLVTITYMGNAQTYFWDDFSGGLTQFTTYNVDGLVPDPNVTGTIFGSSAPYKACIIDTPEGDPIAISTSRYTPAGTSNDWLVITSPINIQSASASLIWKARSYSSSTPDGYKIYISTTGNQVSNFTTVLYTNTGENYNWTTRSVNLAGYVGKNVYIAFVNNNNNKYILGIDNIFVGVTGFLLEDNTLQFTYYKNVAVKGSLKNIGNPISNIIVKYVSRGMTYTLNYNGVNVTTGNSIPFEFGDSITVAGAGNSVTYTLEVTAETVIKTSSGNITLGAFKPFRKVIVEEGTGTWCGWCPRGFVYMKKMNETYPGRFIGIAVHNGDIMTDVTYDAGIRTFIKGYPSGVVNRKYICDPVEFESYYLKALNEFTPAEINLSAYWTDASHQSVNMVTDIVFNINYPGTANFRMAYVVIENNVKGTTANYNQRNYYRENRYGTMGGYEILPDPVPAAQMVYPDVAWKIYDSFDGISNSIPATIKMQEQFKHVYTLQLPASVTNKNEAGVVAMLINNTTREIVNARILSLKNLTEILANAGTTENPGASAKVRKNAYQIVVDVETNNPGPVSAGMYTIDGKQIYNASVNQVNKYSFEIPYTGLRGIYILHVKTNEGTFDEKIVLE
jgi:hypothetical protein